MKRKELGEGSWGLEFEEGNKKCTFHELVEFINIDNGCEASTAATTILCIKKVYNYMKRVMVSSK
jgi:hypothetical protein